MDRNRAHPPPWRTDREAAELGASRPRSVLQLISSTGLYGAERVALELAAFWEGIGWRAHLGVFQRKSRPVEVYEEARRRGLSAFYLPSDGPFDSGTLGRLSERIGALSIDLVHTHGYKTDVCAALLELPAGVRRLATCHTWYSRSLSLLLYELLDKISLHRFDHVVLVSPQLVEEARGAGLPDEKCSMIENGVTPIPPPSPAAVAEIRRRLGVSPEERMILRVGRLDADKGNDVLLRALPRTPAGARPKLVLAGEGEDRPLLERLAADLGLADRVLFLGYRRDVPELLGACDCFVISSPKEGLPLVLLEAMSAGAPIVSTAVGAIPSVIGDGVEGLLVRPHDPDALAQAIGRALCDPAGAREMTRRARARFDREHSQHAMGQKYLRVAERLLATPANPSLAQRCG